MRRSTSYREKILLTGLLTMIVCLASAQVTPVTIASDSTTAMATMDSIQSLRHARLTSLREQLQAKRDSLKPDSPGDTLRHSLNELISQTDSMINMNSLANRPDYSFDDSLQLKTKITSLQRDVDQKLTFLNQQGVQGLPSSTNLPQLPQTSLPDINLPDLGTAGVNMPDAGIPNVEIPSVDLPAVDLPSTDVSVPGINQPTIPDLNTPSLPSLDGIKAIEDPAAKMEEFTGGIGDYQQKVEDLKMDPSKLEEKLTGMEEVSDASAELAKADQLKRYYDPDVAKEEALIKAKQEAINHFAGKEEQLKAAMQKLSDLKAKYSDAEGALDLFAKRQHPLKGKPLIERFIPGVNFQFQKRESFWLDINPQVGFMISRKFTAGLGWNERIAYDFDLEEWDKSNRIYGPRSFVHFKLKENFYLKADIECMNAPARNNAVVQETKSRSWTWSYLAGVKRDFRLSKSMKGNVQLLYNLYNPDNRSPYTNRFNARLGIDILLKKKVKKNEGSNDASQ